MRFQIGNKVAVLDDVLQGKVKSISGDNITIEDGNQMIYEFLASELVLIGQDQYEMSKYSDINNPLLQDKLKETSKPVSNKVTLKNHVVFEVDLHIQELTETTRGMDNYDILSLQLNTAKRKIEYAISKRIGKVIFIHGVGEGVLKNELYRLLKKYPVDYYDAPFQKYGFGATEVYIYQHTQS